MNQQCKDHSGHEARIRELEEKTKQLYVWVYSSAVSALFMLGNFIITKILDK